ncbi:MAG: hypothetical protein KAI55_03920 [Candidatus Aenigmarchaeota archaeon]|nr:hypothetical protein [Candidatus Aenigmarchaeota archaeon]
MISNIIINKISAENKLILKKQEKKMEIGNTLSIKKIEEQELVSGSDKKEKTLFISYEFKIIYKTGENELGNIDFSGSLLWRSEDIEEFIETWKKDKKLPEKYSFIIMNSILRKCILSAINISEQINLPPPINIPIIQEKKVQNIEYIG